jgi:hypothetical protein
MSTPDNSYAYAYFLTSEVPAILDLMVTAQAEASREGFVDVERAIGLFVTGFATDINQVAVEVAGVADGLIIAQIIATQAPNRPNTGEMTQHIKSLPAPLGGVAVALIEELDKIVNPIPGYGPFWRAQEVGTGSNDPELGSVPSQVGRVLFGSFDPSQTAPDGSQAGAHVGTDRAFIPNGPNPGFGTISTEDQPRHFLRDGTIGAAEFYREQMGLVEAKWAKELARILAMIERHRKARGGGFHGLIEA